MSRVRIGPAEQLLTVHLILDGKGTQSHAADRLGISRALLQQWICIYKSGMAKVLFLLLRTSTTESDRILRCLGNF